MSSIPGLDQEQPLTSSKTLARRLALIALLAAGAASPTAAQSLKKRLTKRLDLPALTRHHWGVAVVDETGRLIYERDGERMFTPASNTKLVVTAAATVLLDPGATVLTRLVGDGPVRQGVLEGNLVIEGRGDPTWAARCYAIDSAGPACPTDPFLPLRGAVGQLKAAGIRRIAGAVIGDGRWYEPTQIHPTWETDDAVWGYGAPVSALGFNENLVTVVVTGTAPGQPASVSVTPDLGGLALDHRIETVSPGGRALVDWTRDPGATVALGRGTIPAGLADTSELAVPDPERFTALALARVLADSGIELLGGARGAGPTDRATDPAAPALATIRSRPLRDWVFPILNVSQNWVAEMLLKQLSRQLGGDGSWRDGTARERRFLIDSVGADSSQFILHDGSGLSGKDAVSPLTFARLLDYIRRHPRFADFAAGLPRSGRTGSLEKRFLDTPLAGRIRAKTGSIGQVNTLSGFVTGDSLAAPCRTFSVQANHHTLGGQAMIRAIDSVVVEIGRKTDCERKP